MEHAVNAVFTALIWHTQELREIVASFGIVYTFFTFNV